MKAQVSEKVRHVVLRGEAGDVLPDSLARALYEREVASGWLRASGVLTEVELRVFDTERVSARRGIAARCITALT